MDWSDLALRFVRGAGAIAGAAAGVAALLTEGAFQKREEPLQGILRDTPLAKFRVTRWGGILLGVILVAPTVQFLGDWIKDANDSRTLRETAKDIRQDIKSTLISSTMHAHDDIIGTVQKEAQMQTQSVERVSNKLSQVADSSNRILAQAERIAQPLSDVRGSFWLAVDLSGSSDSQNFVERFKKEIKPLLNKWENQTGAAAPRMLSGAYTSGFELKNGKTRIIDVTVTKESPLYPKEDSEEFVYNLFSYTNPVMYFYKKAIPVENYFGNGSEELNPSDLRMEFDSTASGKMELEYNIPSERFYIRGSSIASDSKYWYSSGNISSFVDLAGSQVFIEIEQSSSSHEKARQLNPAIKAIVVDIGSRNGLWFRNAKLTSHLNKETDRIIYEYRFPPTINEIIADLK